MIDYPHEFEFDVVLRDGDVVKIRPIRTDDQTLLVDLFNRTSPESRYFRFFRAKPRLSPREVEHFTTIDYQRRMALVVIDDEQMIAVARYDTEAEDPTTAEVAFLVEDAQQGRGIGTQLLQLLTVYARQEGILGFTAYVLPENVGMLRLFRNSGYTVSRAYEDGVFTVRFPVAESEDSRAAEHRREQRAVAASVTPIFYPRAIAVIGASPSPGSIGGGLFRNLLASDYSGSLFPIHPTATDVAAVPAFASVLDVPVPLDLAFVVVPAHAVMDVVRQCAEKGVRGLVVISAGFSETGPDGRVLEQDLLETVRSAGMRMVGPNCMGIVNTDVGVRMNGTFAPVYPPAGNVAMLSQSGALGIAILDYARRNAIGISSFVSVGNKADLSGNDLLLYWEGDPSTDVIVLYLESFGNPRRFGRIARRVARTKPIVVVKSGRTAAGHRAASSHTGALASVDTAVDALFQQAGVIRTDTLEELFAVANLLANQPVPSGRRVGIVTNAGGPAILAADALESLGLDIPVLSEATQSRLADSLPAEASVRNPVDMIAGAGPEQFEASLRAVAESGEVDAVMAIYVPINPEGAAQVADAIRTVARSATDATMLSVFMSSDDAGALLSDDEVTVPAYAFPEAAAKALGRSVEYGEWLARPVGDIPVFSDTDDAAAASVIAGATERLGAEGGWLNPDEMAALLAAYGLHLPASRVVQTPEAAVSAWEEIGGPVAVKLVSEEAIHKSDIGGVVLDVDSADAVRSAFAQVVSVVGSFDGVWIQEMVPAGHEVLIGMTEDPSFGRVMVYGMGGVYVELLEDVAIRLNPLTDRDADEMIAEIKSAPLLDGYRGDPGGDIDAVRNLLLRVSAMVSANRQLVELDLNPVMVMPPGHGARVVDARVRIIPLADRWVPELADVPSVLVDGPLDPRT